MKKYLKKNVENCCIESKEYIIFTSSNNNKTHTDMTTSELRKGKMINEIIGMAKNSAFIHQKFFNGADLFFTLAFMSEKEIKTICKKLNISIK